MMIGINTPEIGRNGKASEPGATAARKHLLSLLQEHKQIYLKTDTFNPAGNDMIATDAFVYSR